MPTEVGLVLRPAGPEDATAMADLHVDAREANVGSLPPMVHDRTATRAWMAERLAGGSEGWVAQQADLPVGYLVLTGDWLDDLYVHPAACGRGIGSALLEVARAVRPDGFGLWVFESNVGARRFYRRHGLVELERTDGSGNEEQAPDLRLVWPGADPVGARRRAFEAPD